MKIKFFCYYSLILAVSIVGGCNRVSVAISKAAYPDKPWDKYIEEANKDIRVQLYGEAEKSLSLASEEYRKNGIKAGTFYPYLTIFPAQGKYDEAINASKQSYDIERSHRKDMRLADIARQYWEIGNLYLYKGEYDNAWKNYELMLQYFKENDKIEPHNKGPVRFLIGNYYLQQGDYETARECFMERLNYLLDSKLPAASHLMAKAKNEVGLTYYYAGDEKAAEKLFNEAAGLNGGFASFTEDLIISLTMLGHIAEHRDDNKGALFFYQNALDAVRHDTITEAKAAKSKLLSPWDCKTDQADMLYQIGRLQLKQAHLDESIKAFNDAIQLRLISQTQTHPNYADIFKGLAGVNATRGDLTSATLHATKALQILDASVVPTHPRTAQELVALASIQILSGHPEQTAPLDARLETILQKPLGPWKEDFLETTAFYASLLKKANKTPEAARLEQIYARQKDKR